MEGVSGPGVGSVVIVVHEGGVAMMIFGVGEVTMGGDADAGVQAVAKVESRKKKEMSLLDI
jgi:hypothetical protein